MSWAGTGRQAAAASQRPSQNSQSHGSRRDSDVACGSHLKLYLCLPGLDGLGWTLLWVTTATTEKGSQVLQHCKV